MAGYNIHEAALLDFPFCSRGFRLRVDALPECVGARFHFGLKQATSPTHLWSLILYWHEDRAPQYVTLKPRITNNNIQTFLISVELQSRKTGKNHEYYDFRHQFETPSISQSSDITSHRQSDCRCRRNNVVLFHRIHHRGRHFSNHP